MTLSQQQVRRLFDDGFLIVENVFAREDLQPAMNELAQMVDDLVERLYAAKRITNKHADKGLHTRLIEIDREFPGAAMVFMLKTEIGPRLADLWADPRLLDMIEQFIGPDVAGHPVFALRSKIPSNRLLTVPWHQDMSYLLPEADATDQVTCWIPFEDVNVENGCMQYIRGGNQGRQLYRHHIEGQVGGRSSPYLYIAEQDLPKGEIVTCDMKLGSVLFHMQHSPHRSLENHSDTIRWSVDFRYQRPDQPTGLEGDSWVLVDMRRHADPSYRPDLTHWLQDKQRKRRADYFSQAGVDEFDISSAGTDKTMKRWADAAT